MRPSTQYLLRFDDLCPTMAAESWQSFLQLLAQYKIKPILAIVPNNQDPILNLSPPDPGFWQQMRQLQSEGATIVLHGYRHLCTQRGRSLIPLHRETEFSGAPEQLQREWIHAGLAILRNQGLNPRLFVAPRHGFDHSTLRALKAEGLSILSDGFARRPYQREGITWLPQQLWAPVEKSSGLWTICLHSNTASDLLLTELEVFLKKNAAYFTNVDRVLAEYVSTPLSPLESIQARLEISKIRLRKFNKLITPSR